MAVIEPARSSRATCRSCNDKISKGKARLGIEQEMTRGDNTFVSTKWHHLDCGIENYPDEILVARFEEYPDRDLLLSEEAKERVEEVRDEFNKAGMAIQSISAINKPNITVNVKATVLRKMSASEETNDKGETMTMAPVYVQEKDDEDVDRTKFLLWGDHASLEVERDDQIVIIGSRTNLASNENIQFHAHEDSTVLVNPTEEEIDEHVESFELFISDAWNRPSGMPVEFVYAPSGKASCVICYKKIKKGELKLVKPEWMENEDTGHRFPGNRSFHLQCAIEDDHGEDLLHEAVTRMPPTMLDENREELKTLMENLPKITAKSILNNLLT